MLGGREVHRLGTCITTSLLARRYLTYWQMQTSLIILLGLLFDFFDQLNLFTVLSYIDIDSSSFFPFFFSFFPFSSVNLIYTSTVPTQQEEQTPNLPARMSPLTTTSFSSIFSSSLLALTLASSAAAETLSCSAAALHDAASHVPTLRGVQIQEVLANPLKDWMEEPSPVPRAMPLVVQQTGPLSFCNVTVVYTHPGLFGLFLFFSFSFSFMWRERERGDEAM